MTKIEARVTQLVVVPDGEPIYSEMATTIEIQDDAGGEYVIVEQHGRLDLGKIAINPDEWPALRAAINRMIRQCRGAS